MSRIYCNTIIGSAAEGSNYFARPNIEKKIIHQLEKGVFIHFTAPRRVGKTSILKAIASRNIDGLVCIFENIESDRLSNDLYKRFINLIERALSNKTKIYKKTIAYLKSKKIKGVSIESIDLDHEEMDYKQLFLDLVDDLKESNERVVLFVDEFPDVIANIARNEGNEAALDVLNTIRSVRQTNEFKRSFGLVLSGSIGLTHVVRSIGRPKLINDLKVITLDPLNEIECDEFISFLTEGATLTIPEDVRQHVKTKLQQYIPYYIQLIVEGGDELTDDKDRTTLTTKDVDEIYENLAKDNDKFIDWVDRIKEYHNKDYPFLKRILTHTAYHNNITIQSIANIANESKQEDYEELIHQVLIKDGYLYKQDNNIYAFASPLLRDWWKHHYSIHS